jgi:hypothetical protein
MSMKEDKELLPPLIHTADADIIYLFENMRITTKSKVLYEGICIYFHDSIIYGKAKGTP